MSFCGIAFLFTSSIPQTEQAELEATLQRLGLATVPVTSTPSFSDRIETESNGNNAGQTSVVGAWPPESNERTEIGHGGEQCEAAVVAHEGEANDERCSGPEQWTSDVVDQTGTGHEPAEPQEKMDEALREDGAVKETIEEPIAPAENEHGPFDGNGQLAPDQNHAEIETIHEPTRPEDGQETQFRLDDALPMPEVEQAIESNTQETPCFDTPPQPSGVNELTPDTIEAPEHVEVNDPTRDLVDQTYAAPDPNPANPATDPSPPDATSPPADPTSPSKQRRRRSRHSTPSSPKPKAAQESTVLKVRKGKKEKYIVRTRVRRHVSEERQGQEQEEREQAEDSRFMGSRERMSVRDRNDRRGGGVPRWLWSIVT